ncbi:hypothetical protein [Constrictibacter sp. MBR-5]|uniref:hypothetical protein n=1 Tax=Constrictibacter sp. MBR-5 TaxID=3156467 RepID=UPI003393D0CE
MSKWMRGRFAEPSTYAGLGAVVAGVGQIAGAPELGAVAQIVAGESSPWGLLAAAMGLGAMFLREKGER